MAAIDDATAALTALNTSVQNLTTAVQTATSAGPGQTGGLSATDAATVISGVNAAATAVQGQADALTKVFPAPAKP